MTSEKMTREEALAAGWHDADCRFCEAGEPMTHNYEPPETNRRCLIDCIRTDPDTGQHYRCETCPELVA